MQKSACNWTRKVKIRKIEINSKLACMTTSIMLGIEQKLIWRAIGGVFKGLATFGICSEWSLEGFFEMGATQDLFLYRFCSFFFLIKCLKRCISHFYLMSVQDGFFKQLFPSISCHAAWIHWSRATVFSLIVRNICFKERDWHLEYAVLWPSTAETALTLS